MNLKAVRGLVLTAAIGMTGMIGPLLADEPARDSSRDILVTFENANAGSSRSGIGAPYRNRKRYAITAEARRHAATVADDYSLVEVDSWPIKSLSVYCVVYRADHAEDRRGLLDELSKDPRIESVQALQEFGTETEAARVYDDTYVNLQHGFATMSVSAAHRHSLGEGVRVAIVDSEADIRHEDLRGRLHRIERLSADGKTADTDHGTAIASVIAANANNAKGIVGIAPEARIDLFAACWAEEDSESAVCDSFSLAKALDMAIADAPDVVNLSLTGPYDPLLARLLIRLYQAGVILVSAVAPDLNKGNEFPASLEAVIGVSSSADRSLRDTTGDGFAASTPALFAPGNQILVAVPDDQYDFRSGSSLAAAHVSGIVALLLAAAPELSADQISNVLQQSQASNSSDGVSVNACAALQVVDVSRDCR